MASEPPLFFAVLLTQSEERINLWAGLHPADWDEHPQPSVSLVHVAALRELLLEGQIDLRFTKEERNINK